jgi:hypothetical protein
VSDGGFIDLFLLGEANLADPDPYRAQRAP